MDSQINIISLIRVPVALLSCAESIAAELYKTDVLIARVNIDIVPMQNC